PVIIVSYLFSEAQLLRSVAVDGGTAYKSNPPAAPRRAQFRRATKKNETAAVGRLFGIYSPLPCTRGRGAGGEGAFLCKCCANRSHPPHPRPLSPEYRGEGRKALSNRVHVPSGARAITRCTRGAGLVQFGYRIARVLRLRSGSIMSVAILCAGCHRSLRVPETVLGQTVQCPLCIEAFVAERDPNPPPLKPPAAPSRPS